MDAVAVITAAVADLGTDLTGVATIGLGVGVGLFALTKGWGLVKRFTN